MNQRRFLTATDFCAIARHTHFIISLDAIRLPRDAWNGQAETVKKPRCGEKRSKNQKSYKKIKIIISLD